MAEMDPGQLAAAAGRVLRACRLDRGLTQEELADQAGLSVRAIRDLERGRAVPRSRTVDLLACALNVDLGTRNRLDALVRTSRALRRAGEPDATGVTGEHRPTGPPPAGPANAPVRPVIAWPRQRPERGASVPFGTLGTAHSQAERERAALRLARWYLATAVAADRMIAPCRHRGPLNEVAADNGLPRFASRQEATAWCDSESASLVAAARHAAAAGDHATAWQIPWALLPYFDLRKARDEWLASHETGLASARESGDLYGQAAMLTGLGLMHYYPRHFAEATDCYQRAGTLWREAGEQHGSAAILNSLGNVRMEQRDLRGAVDRYRGALRIDRAIGDRHGQGVVLNNLAEAHCELGAFDRALEYASAAVAVNSETGYRRMEAFSLCHLARALAATGFPDDAITRFCEAIDVSTVIGDRQAEAWAFEYLGRALASAGQASEARLHWGHAIDLFDAIGDPQVGDLRNRLGRLPA